MKASRQQARATVLPLAAMPDGASQRTRCAVPASPAFTAVAPVIWQERVSSIWLSPHSRRTSKWPSQEQKLETSDRTKSEATEHCGGTQSLARWFLLRWTGGAHTFCQGSRAAACFPARPALACVRVFVTLPWQPARKSHSPAGEKPIAIPVPVQALPRVSQLLSASSSLLSAVSLKTRSDTLLHHRVLLRLCLGGSNQESWWGPLQPSAASAMDQDPLTPHQVRRTKRAQTASRQAKRDIILPADFCELLIGLRICSTICKCYNFIIQLF